MVEILQSSIRLTTPLLFAAMGGMLCERSGVATICLEGAILIGAFFAATIAHATHSPWLALVPAMASGAILMSLHAWLTSKAKADHIISGLVVNLFVAGMTPLLCKWLYDTPTNSPGLALEDRFHEWVIPGLEAISIGPLFHQMPLTLFALLLVLLLPKILFSTRWGLQLTACGEDPETLSTTGVQPLIIRFQALALGGALAALGGAFLSISHASQFTRDMAAGRGYIALTALIFGSWRPWPTAAACFLFGFADAVQIRLQGGGVPIQFIQALPYFTTLVVLVGFARKSRAPAAIGKRF